MKANAGKVKNMVGHSKGSAVIDQYMSCLAPTSHQPVHDQKRQKLKYTSVVFEAAKTNKPETSFCTVVFWCVFEKTQNGIHARNTPRGMSVAATAATHKGDLPVTMPTGGVSAHHRAELPRMLAEAHVLPKSRMHVHVVSRNSARAH
jgi:hypothetical protein